MIAGRTALAFVACVALVAGCGSATGGEPAGKEAAMTDVVKFADGYARAWSSQDAASVAAHFAPGGSLKVNDGEPSVGRAAITATAQSFMTALPDMVVTNDGIEQKDGRTIFHWTLTGTNTGPGGTGRSVKVSGQENWKLGPGPLIEESIGAFDAADYDRQLAGEG